MIKIFRTKRKKIISDVNQTPLREYPTIRLISMLQMKANRTQKIFCKIWLKNSAIALLSEVIGNNSVEMKVEIYWRFSNRLSTDVEISR